MHAFLHNGRAYLNELGIYLMYFDLLCDGEVEVKSYICLDYIVFMLGGSENLGYVV